MNRVINDPDQVVEDMLRGILVAHPELRQYETNPRVIGKAKPSPQGRVGIVTGGGSGHEPAFLGYVGPGLVDGGRCRWSGSCRLSSGQHESPRPGRNAGPRPHRRPST